MGRDITAPRKKKEADADETIHHCLAEPPAGLSGEPPGRLTPLPYETMNHLLADRPDHRAGVLEKAGKGSGEFALAEVQVLAPIPHPRQDVICLGMNYQKHKTEAERV